jgi:lysophospholipase L1-like esterase
MTETATVEAAAMESATTKAAAAEWAGRRIRRNGSEADDGRCQDREDRTHLSHSGTGRIASVIAPLQAITPQGGISFSRPQRN